MDLVCACNGLLPHVRRGRSRFMDLVCACDALSPLPVQEIAFSCTRRECSRWTSPLPVKEKAISWTWCALAMGFSPCLSKKRPSHGLGGNARDGLSPLPVKEKAVSWTWCALAGGFPRRPRRPPEVPGELSMPKHAIIVNNCSTKVMVFGARSKLYIREAPGRFQEASRLTFDRVLF